MIRVLIGDDEALMRTGLRLILDTAADVEVVAEADDGPAAVRACRRHAVDVALLDVRMPGGDGLTAAAEIARVSAGTHVVVLTTFDDDDAVTRALRAGAVGFLTKDIGPGELIQAVRSAARGEPVLAPQVMRRLVAQHLSAPDRASQAAQRIAALTPAERDVLEVLGEGLSNAEIAERLYLSVGTAKAHVGRILSKLGCANRVQAAILAHEAGLPDRP